MNRLTSCMAALLAAGSATAAPLSLSPGVLIDSAEQMAIAVDPTGYTNRLNLTDGAIAWKSAEKVYPLALADGILLGVGVPDAPGTANLIVMRPATGEIEDRVAIDLPENVSANVFPRPKRRFAASVLDTPEGMRVFWRHEYAELRGAATMEIDSEGNEAINPITVLTGAFDLVRDGDRYYAVPIRGAFEEPSAPILALADEERVAGVPGVQYRAADNTHALVSAASDDDVFGTIWTWTIYERSGRAKGGYRSPYAYVPYLVSGDHLIIRDQPIEYLKRGEMVARGTRLVSIDLSSGAERWSFDVLDQEYRGPLPP